MTNQIFICYRRSDSQVVCDRIYASLTAIFGADQVFRDISTIAAGVDFRVAVEHALRSAKIALVIIGPSWLTATDDTGHRRLDDPQDQVRQEVELALSKNVILVPVLVQQATMPRESDLPTSIGALSYRNSRSVRPDPDYARDIHAVIADIAGYLPPAPLKRPLRSLTVGVRGAIGFVASLLTIALTVLSLATWINIPVLSELVRRLFGH